MADLKQGAKLILLRHGQSDWNNKNLFTGWVDIPLSIKGIDEAVAAGKRISNVPIDVIFTSSLIRAQMTGMLAMAQHSSGKTPYIIHENEGKLSDWSKIYNEKSAGITIPVYRAWQLNERYYGELQGLNKDETRAKYGEEQVHIWRRSYDVPPPNGEALMNTAERSIPFFEENILPHLKQGKNVFIAAHGNSLRSIVMKLDNLSREEVLKLEIATGDPLCYHLQADGKLKKVAVDDVQASYAKK